MGIHSLIFITAILPGFLFAYLLFRKAIFWPLLFIFSLGYFLWLDPVYFPLIIVMLVVNYLAGRLLTKKPEKWLMSVSVGLNILLLAFFKAHEAGLFAFTANILGAAGDHIPIGISFLTFTSVAYLLDSFNQRIKEQPGFFKYGTFQLFFAKAIAGPIIRFPNMEKNVSYSLEFEEIANGIRRFIQGFLKKVLIADLLGVVVDRVFVLPTANRSLLLTWISLFFFTLQIYFDFSGYTDMAIGVGKMFGITLPENFNDPYFSKSIGEFWRRWHITLSNWFRDYVFFPLERKRRGKRFWSQAINVLIVFLLTGLWHGFGANYIIWGLIHGVVIAAENSKIGQSLRKKIPAFLQHIYTLGVIIASWIFFRAPSFVEAKRYIRSLIRLDKLTLTLPVSEFPPIENLTWVVFIVGLILCTPLPKYLAQKYSAWSPANQWVKPVLNVFADVFLLAVMVFAIGLKIDSTFSSFLYGNF